MQPKTKLTGYLHPVYAESFSAIASPRELPYCGGWLLERLIPGSNLRDGMGCYPMFACRDWARVPVDLSLLVDRMVSVSLVTDPFGEFTGDDLRRWFDVVLPHKQHYVIDLDLGPNQPMSRSHQRNTARALSRVQLETCPEPLQMLQEWIGLYNHLVERHRITGIKAFSAEGFRKQLGVPGVKMFKASSNGRLVGLHLWYLHDEVAYGHLGATSAYGSELMASYALYWYAIQQLRGQVRWLDLGGGAGVSEPASSDGLRRFKAGWSTGVRQAYLCGRILQPEAYATLVSKNGVGRTTYFPAYRLGEFADLPAASAEKKC